MVLDTSAHPPRVHRLEHEIKGWMGDDLMTTFPCFVATTGLIEADVTIDKQALRVALAL